ATHARGLLDPPQRPPEPAKCQDLLFLLVAQDVAHLGGGPLPSRPRQRPAPSAPLAGFQTIMLGRFWVIPEARGTCRTSRTAVPWTEQAVREVAHPGGCPRQWRTGSRSQAPP